MSKELFILGALLGSALIYLENYSIVSSEYEVRSDKIPMSFNNFKILQISDFHCKKFGYNNKLLLDKIIHLNPDIVVMTGDMVSRKNISFAPFLDLAAELAKRYPVYYIIGNHELDLSDDELSFMFNKLRNLGVNVLNNEKAEIKRYEDHINLYGMWYGLRYYKDTNGSYKNHEKFNYSEMLRILGNKSTEDYSILLAHNPLDFKTYCKWKPDLIFSGHVHGGVVRLPVLGGLLSPGRNFLPKYYEGRYTKNGTTMIVSRGIGGIRLFNKPELVVTTLKSKDF